MITIVYILITLMFLNKFPMCKIQYTYATIIQIIVYIVHGVTCVYVGFFFCCVILILWWWSVVVLNIQGDIIM